jgi:acyl-CoA dehydrogenase
MAWDFETDPEFQTKLDWIETFMREEVEPVSHLGMAAYGPEGRERYAEDLKAIKAGWEARKAASEAQAG